MEGLGGVRQDRPRRKWMAPLAQMAIRAGFFQRQRGG
jgi:hypothetical protein